MHCCLILRCRTMIFSKSQPISILSYIGCKAQIIPLKVFLKLFTNVMMVILGKQCSRSYSHSSLGITLFSFSLVRCTFSRGICLLHTHTTTLPYKPGTTYFPHIQIICTVQQTFTQHGSISFSCIYISLYRITAHHMQSVQRDSYPSVLTSQSHSSYLSTIVFQLSPSSPCVQFHLSSEQVGLVFLPSAILYTLTCLLVGRLSDKFVSQYIICNDVYESICVHAHCRAQEDS